MSECANVEYGNVLARLEPTYLTVVKLLVTSVPRFHGTVTEPDHNVMWVMLGLRNDFLLHKNGAGGQDVVDTVVKERVLHTYSRRR